MGDDKCSLPSYLVQLHWPLAENAAETGGGLAMDWRGRGDGLVTDWPGPGVKSDSGAGLLFVPGAKTEQH